MKRRDDMELDYQMIVDKLQSIIPMQWKKVVYMAEYTSGSYSMRCFYDNGDGKYLDCLTVAGNSKVQIIKVYKELDNEIQKVRKTLEGDKLWYSLTLKIESDGNFKAEYDYDSHEENAIGYIDAWKRNNL